MNSVLSECNVLIVEDDSNLAERLKNYFKVITGILPTIVDNMKDAIEIVLNDKNIFNLAIVDIMLPMDKDTYKKRKEFVNELEKVRNEIGKIDIFSSIDSEQKKLTELRIKRSEIQKWVEVYIIEEGGIEIVKKWREYEKEFPVLYLTAVGNNALVNEVLSIARCYAEWLVKPVSSDVIKSRAESLIVDFKKQNIKSIC